MHGHVRARQFWIMVIMHAIWPLIVLNKHDKEGKYDSPNKNGKQYTRRYIYIYIYILIFINELILGFRFYFFGKHNTKF
jgi:hypothetical protein